MGNEAAKDTDLAPAPSCSTHSAWEGHFTALVSAAFLMDRQQSLGQGSGQSVSVPPNSYAEAPAHDVMAWGSGK